jgi:hypothetical protein
MKKTKSLIMLKLIQAVLLYSSPVIAAISEKPNWPVTCHCPRANQTWIIEANKITVKQAEDRPSERFRQIASGPLEIFTVRTHQTAEGMSKVVQLNGQQITIGLHPSNESAYLTMRSAEGHEIMYPMDCQ